MKYLKYGFRYKFHDKTLPGMPISSESYEKDTWIPLIYEIR